MLKRKLLKLAHVQVIYPLSKFMFYVMQYFKDWCFLVNLYDSKDYRLENTKTHSGFCCNSISSTRESMTKSGFLTLWDICYDWFLKGKVNSSYLSWQEILHISGAQNSRKLGFTSCDIGRQSHFPDTLLMDPICTERKRVEFTKVDKSSKIHHYWQMSQSMWKNYRE